MRLERVSCVFESSACKSRCLFENLLVRGISMSTKTPPTNMLLTQSRERYVTSINSLKAAIGKGWLCAQACVTVELARFSQQCTFKKGYDANLSLFIMLVKDGPDCWSCFFSQFLSSDDAVSYASCLRVVFPRVSAFRRAIIGI